MPAHRDLFGPFTGHEVPLLVEHAEVGQHDLVVAGSDLAGGEVRIAVPVAPDPRSRRRGAGVLVLAASSSSAAMLSDELGPLTRSSGG